MTETQRRIKAYQKALPELRERVIAVALLLAMSASMLSTASFAWLTLSRNPEVTNVSTTVAANGNLEIALATSYTAPGESAVGDSSAAEGQSIVSANNTWGNLINLTDPSYGLEHMVMRPAQLNKAELLTSPLWGADYSSDGRITQMNNEFGYVSWQKASDGTYQFMVSDALGVRGISSMTASSGAAENILATKLNDAKRVNLAAANAYSSIPENNPQYMQSLATMMGLYMTASMNAGQTDEEAEALKDPTVDMEDIQNLRDMYGDFIEIMEMEFQAIAQLANATMMVTQSSGFTEYDKDTIKSATSAQLKAKGIVLSSDTRDKLDGNKVNSYDQFVTDYNTICADYAVLNELCEGSTSALTWADTHLNDIVNKLVRVGACTIGESNTPISSIGASNAMGYLDGTQEARITNGILYRFEERVGGYLEVMNLSISAKVRRMGMTIPATVKANIKTTAPRDYNLFNIDWNTSKKTATDNGSNLATDMVAEDTYGLAIDLWLRTNAANSYLMLEGNALTKTEEILAMGKDANGNETQLYTLTRTNEGGEEGEETVAYTMDVYKVTTPDPNDSTKEIDTWYDATSHSTVTLEEGETPTIKMTELVTVIGYEGENRVWDRERYNSILSTDATTQGSGSCYVYYADTPEDQARSLKLLEAYNVAFVSSDGRALATAVMDTEHFFAESGRVTVPLVLSPSDSIPLPEDFEGNVRRGIMELPQNTPTRITAIVYLDGTKLTNQDVLAAADIQGQLNIQFGSTMTMEPVEDEKLMNQTVQVSAELTGTEFDFDKVSEPMTTNIKVTVDGTSPSTVKAFFLRQINATQGSRETEFTLTKNADGVYEANYTFTSPGTYILRSVRLDGVDYDLQVPKTVKVSGFAVTSLEQTGTSNIMSVANSHSVGLKLKFAADDVSRMPATVQGRYLRQDGTAVNVNFTYQSSGADMGFWTGTATFLSSGEYTLQYLVLDGKYTELPSTMWRTVTVTLGMKVAVYTTSPNTFKYELDNLKENQRLLAMQVKIMDDTGKEMPNLSGVKLTYKAGTRPMDADLHWNGSYYVGNLPNQGPGTWTFASLTAAGNTLSSATTYPIFNIQSPNPPSYEGHQTKAYQFAPNRDATMHAAIAYTDAARVAAYVVKNGASEGTWVKGNQQATQTEWSFPVPQDVNGYQDGTWQITQLKVWGAYAADGTEYTEEAPLVIDVAHTNNRTRVVNRVKVSFNKDLSKDFGKEADTVTGTFMQSHTISGLNVTITDNDNQPLLDDKNNLMVSDVKLTFTYQNGTSSSYGGYSSTELNNNTAGATIEVPLAPGADQKAFVQGADQTIKFAGSYITTFDFKVNGVSYSYADDADGAQELPSNAPKFTVSSSKPKLTVNSASTNNGSWAINGTKFNAHTGTGNNSASITQVQNTYNAETNELTVYIAATYFNGKVIINIGGAGVYYNTQKQDGYESRTVSQVAEATCPKVKFSLSNAGSAFDAASFVINGDNNLSISATINRDNNETGTFITDAYRIGNVSGQYGFTVFGQSLGALCTTRTLFGSDKTVSAITMTHGGISYTVTLDKPLTINNPA